VPNSILTSEISEDDQFHDSELGDQPEQLVAPPDLSSGEDYGSEDGGYQVEANASKVEEGGALKSARGSIKRKKTIIAKQILH
jgi:hypothetical protein